MNVKKKEATFFLLRSEIWFQLNGYVKPHKIFHVNKWNGIIYVNSGNSYKMIATRIIGPSFCMR